MAVNFTINNEELAGFINKIIQWLWTDVGLWLDTEG